MGRLEEGLREFGRHETDPLLPAGMYQSFQAGIHDAARDYDRALELRARSVELMPDNMALKIDLAMGYAQRKRDPARARAILEGIDPDLVMELARPWVQLVRGLIALEEGDVVGAKEFFKGALDGFEPFRDAISFFSVVLLTKSYLCLALALAGAGDRLQAREMYREVSVFLESVREVELLERIRVALAAQDP
jgi:tetratricopeptide (TPR) repeat protein